MLNTGHIHPMLVHFPIVLIFSGLLIDIIYLFFIKEPILSRISLFFLIAGTLSAWIAFGTGHIFTQEPHEGDISVVFNRHETSALLTVILMTLALIVRVYLIRVRKENSNLKWVILGLYFLGFILVSYTGYMGGTMVYDYMMMI